MRCWICGNSAKPHNTNVMDPNAPDFDLGANNWCSGMVTNAACQPDKPGQELFCYKEIWTVDGSESRLKNTLV